MVDVVTGAFGFSGSSVVRQLLASGRRVRALEPESVLRDPARRERMRLVGLDLEHPHLELVAADLLDPGTLPAALEGATRVFHTASLYDYSASLERLVSVNVEGTRNLLDALPPDVDRFVHWSTCGVFGKPYPVRAGKRANLPFDERSSSPRNTVGDGPTGTNLVNAYSISKWQQEQLVWKRHRDDGLPLTVIRPAPIYGPGSDYGHMGIVIAIARGYVPAIPSDARNAVTTSVHVDDLARFALFAADRTECIGEDYDVVDDSIVSYSEFLHYIALLCGRRMVDVPLLPLSAVRRVAEPTARAWTWAERRLGLPRVRVLEVQSAVYIGSSYWLANDKTKAAGFAYRYADVREGLKDAVAWLRRAGWV